MNNYLTEHRSYSAASNFKIETDAEGAQYCISTVSSRATVTYLHRQEMRGNAGGLVFSTTTLKPGAHVSGVAAVGWDLKQAPATTTSTSPSTSPSTIQTNGSGGGGLSTGAKAGIGVGVAVGALVLIMLALLNVRHRRKQQEMLTETSKETPEVSQPDFPMELDGNSGRPTGELGTGHEMPWELRGSAATPHELGGTDEPAHLLSRNQDQLRELDGTRDVQELE